MGEVAAVAKCSGESVSTIATALGSAVIAAIISALVTALLQNRSSRFTAYQTLVAKRSEVYPALFVLISDLPKMLDEPCTVRRSLTETLEQFNQLDSKHAIFMSKGTSNACSCFRQQLVAVVANLKTPTRRPKSCLKRSALNREKGQEPLKLAADLECALRTDLGIAGWQIKNNAPEPKHVIFRLPHMLIGEGQTVAMLAGRPNLRSALPLRMV